MDAQRTTTAPRTVFLPRPSAPGRLRTPTLLGRRAECDVLARLAADVAAGSSRVLVLRGEAGVGKSALLSHLAGLTTAWRVTTAAGVESEVELAYSGLHQLCAPLLQHLPDLPAPQRDALATVFGLRAGAVPDRFLVGLATLTLLAEAAEDRPLACVVEDAQWLDRASARTLAFVGRRLLAERVALVAAARTGGGDDALAELPSLAVHGLGDADARRLLHRRVPGPIDPVVADRVVAESHGNPLALTELPRTWRPADLAGGFGMPGSGHVAGRIEESFTRRLLVLPGDTRLLVLLAAAEPLGDPALLGRAAALLRLPMTGLLPAVDAGLLTVRGRVEFAHPLVRSAVYGASRASDRHRVHAALAGATDAGRDPDRYAWHRARAAAGPDEAVAAELERSAGRARARGGLAAAAAFLARSVELTPDPAQRVRRALDAALACVQAGTLDAARDLLGVARSGPATEFQRARTDLLAARLAFAERRGDRAPALLLAAARRLEPLDGPLARRTYLDAFAAAQFAARLSAGVSTRDVAAAARSAPRTRRGTPAVDELLLDALVALADGDAGAVPLGRAALRALREDTASPGDQVPRLWLGCVLALELWDDESAHVLSARHLELADGSGALPELPLALGAHVPVLVLRGELTAAAALVEQERSLHEVAGIGAARYGALTLAAWRGREGETAGLVEAVRGAATARGEGLGVAIGEYALAVVANGLGRYDEAVAAARRACQDPQEAVVPGWGLAELVEAAALAGHQEVAADAARRLADRAVASGTPWGAGTAARARALLAGDGDAEAAHRESLRLLGQAGVRAQLARGHLLFGEWLRRTGRRDDARTHLTTAYTMFTRMGADGFAERTRGELNAVGATVHRRVVESRADLTAQEAHIARLARDGLSNPEIGAELFISARTVEWHLRKVFTKLGIGSRRDLRRVLPEQRRQTTGL